MMENQNRINNLLQSALDNLIVDDFKRFKDKLSHSAIGKKGTIPRGRLENADRIDTKNILMEHCPGAAAVDVTISVLTQINLLDSATKLSKERDQALGPQQAPETSAHAYRAKYRERIRNQYGTIEDMNAHLGENVKLNSRYTKLMIVKDHRHKTQREHEIMASGHKHAEIMNEQDNLITIGDLFKSDENRELPQNVVLQGAAGIGKTLTAKKIMLDWANGELYQNKFDYVFYIYCREINTDSNPRSVEDLILKNCSDKNAPIEEILSTPEKLLFIIDGFDELKFSFNQPSSVLCSDPCEKQPLEITLSSLCRKVVLDKSYLLITTRPTALEKLKKCLKCERCVEILGFSASERKEYFYKFFGNEKQGRKAFNFVKENEMLFTMCFVPIVCWIICTVLKQQMEAGKDLAQNSKTVTDVYMYYLFSLLNYHSISKQEAQDNIKGLCSLAADGIWRQKILFEKEDIKKHGLDKPDSLFLNENMFQRDIDCEYVYSFIHLTFQEFFAALFYLLEKEETVENPENAIHSAKQLLEKCEESKNYLMLTVQFLFGLSNEKRMKDLEEKLGCKFLPQIKNNLLMWVKEKPFSLLYNYDEKLSPDREWSNFCLDYFQCLHEIQELEFVQSAMNNFTELKLKYHHFTKMDQIVLQFCIKNCYKLESLWIDSCGFHTELLNEESARQCKKQRRAKYQREQYHSPIYRLCQVLKDSKCKLKTLKLRKCYIRDTCCEDLAAVLRAHYSLQELDLSGNYMMGDTGLQLLCKALTQANCKLQKLCLCNCTLTNVCCRDLAAYLSTNQSLTDLDLEGNCLGDAGLQLVCQALMQANCKLQRLNMLQCSLTGTIRDFATFLGANQSLTELDLTHNFLGDAGVKLLCEELTHTNCQLEKLKLWGCNLTDACCRYLASFLSTNQSLTELDLKCNELSDAGVRLLCEGLKHPNCKLQILDLSHCSISNNYGDLSAVLRTNQTLEELMLGSNALTVRGLKLLCEALKHPDCKLQRLGLGPCSLKHASCKELAEVLRTNQSLTMLDLESSVVGDAGMKLLCEGLKDPNCKLQSLNLIKCGITATCCESLADVFKTNQSLRELQMTYYRQEDFGMRLLCEGLKHPDCKLERVFLGYHLPTPEMQAEMDAVKQIKPDLFMSPKMNLKF